jgi:hypothetical protein
MTVSRNRTRQDFTRSDTASLIDVAQLGRFLKAVDPNAERYIFYALDHATGAYTQQIGGATQGTLRWLNAQQSAGRSVFVAAQEMQGTRRLNAETKRFRLVVADLDCGLPSCGRFPLDPTIVIETSSGRYQAIWHIAPQGRQLTEEEWRGIERRLAADYGADLNCAKPAQGVRLPGTVNHKPDRNQFRVAIVDETGAVYTVDEILANFPPVADPDPGFAAGAYCGDEPRLSPQGALQKRYLANFEAGFADDLAELSGLAEGGRNDPL